MRPCSARCATSRRRSTRRRWRPGVPLREQVDIDSVDYLRVLVELNEKVGVDIPEADYARIATIDQLVAYLAGRTGTARAGPPAG